MQTRITTTPIASLQEYRSHDERSQEIERRRRSFERGLVAGRSPFSVAGWCGVCDRRVEFRVDFRYAYEVDGELTPNWREQLVCPSCRLNNRMRATLELVEQLLDPLEGSRIFVCEQLTPVYQRLSARYPGAVGSEHLGDRVPLGEVDAQGIRNEDLTRLTFPSESFDLAVCLDVLEHVARASDALAELARVLRRGGRLLLSVPFLPDRQETLVRARMSDDGRVEHLMTPEYHGDPLSSAGCLAFYHFGWQLLADLAAAGLGKAAGHLYWSSELGHLGSDQLMFVAEKTGGEVAARLGSAGRRATRPAGSLPRPGGDSADSAARRSDRAERRQSYLEQGVSMIEDLLWRSRAWWWLPVRRRGGRRYELRWATYDDITEGLAAAGVRVVSHTIDVDGFWRYVEESGYRSMGYFHGGAMANATEKWLEHWVSIELLRPEPGQVLIDIASRASPFPEILATRHGVRAYRQDLIYEDGVHGDQIGGSAAAMPVGDGFADLMTLHCSFEHFEGDADSAFVREAARVLKPAGRVCILPLYTTHRYSIQSDPATWRSRQVRFEPEATVCLARGWGETHGRTYDVPRFLERIVSNLGELDLTLYAIRNYQEVLPDCYLRFAAVLAKSPLQPAQE